ncbi:MAG: cobalamin-binding protein [Archaeoglobales archaeon]|nr:MAG: cobalamin-binding protein [Archaeoglobales archaeon]
MNWRVILITLIILGCVGKSCVTVIDDFGYEVYVEKYPERIVSLSPSSTEILFALGLGDRVVGVTDQCNYPPEVLKLKEEGKISSVGGYSAVDVERVLRLKPDLVIASYGNGYQVVRTLKDFVPVLGLNPKNVSGVMKDVMLIGKVCGVEDNATKLVEWMKDKMKVGKHRWKPKILHIIWNNPIWVSGRGTFVDDLIRLAGGTNAVNESGWVVLSLEDLIRIDPDLIIVNSGDGMNSKGRNVLYEWIMGDENLKVLKAVRTGRVYVIDSDLISRPSHRVVYVIENISNIIDLALKS